MRNTRDVYGTFRQTERLIRRATEVAAQKFNLRARHLQPAFDQWPFSEEGLVMLDYRRNALPTWQTYAVSFTELVTGPTPNQPEPPVSWDVFHRLFKQGDEVFVVNDEDRVHWGRLGKLDEPACRLTYFYGCKTKFVSWNSIVWMSHQGYPVRMLTGAAGSSAIESSDNRELLVYLRGQLEHGGFTRKQVSVLRGDEDLTRDIASTLRGMTSRTTLTERLRCRRFVRDNLSSDTYSIAKRLVQDANEHEVLVAAVQEVIQDSTQADWGSATFSPIAASTTPEMPWLTQKIQEQWASLKERESEYSDYDDYGNYSNGGSYRGRSGDPFEFEAVDVKLYGGPDEECLLLTARDGAQAHLFDLQQLYLWEES